MRIDGSRSGMVREDNQVLAEAGAM
jgi:hypothetical protein